LTINAVIKQTCITLSDVYIEKKNLEYFIFRQVTDCAALSFYNTVMCVVFEIIISSRKIQFICISIPFHLHPAIRIVYLHLFFTTSDKIPGSFAELRFSCHSFVYRSPCVLLRLGVKFV
jgi:hypothetical protein